MAILNRFIPAALIAASLTGCMTDFEPPLNDPERICMSTLITADETFEVSLSHTWRYSRDAEWWSNDIQLSDASVEVSINGRHVETLTPRANIQGRVTYPSTVRPQSGDTVRLRAVCKGYDDALAEVIVPQPVPWGGITPNIDPGTIYSSQLPIGMRPRLSFAATVEDNLPGEDRFTVGISILVPQEIATGDTVEYWNGNFGPTFWYSGLRASTIDFSREPLFSEHLSALDKALDMSSWGCTFFSDRSFSGLSYPLTLSLQDVYYQWNNPRELPELNKSDVVFTLSHITDAYYDYLVSSWNMDSGYLGSLSEAGLAPSIGYSSNVSTGAGIVAARAVVRDTIDLFPYFEPAIREALNR